MKKLHHAMTLAALLSGCSSIDQVPLIYASTTRVGLSAESGTPQVPGAKVIFGYDSTDLAMVPVATARACDDRDGHDCKDYPIDRVRGSNSISPAVYLLATKAHADALSAASDTVSQAQRAAVAATKDANDARTALATLRNAAVVKTDGVAVPGAASDPAAGTSPAAAPPDPMIKAAEQKVTDKEKATTDAEKALELAYVRFAERRADLDEAVRNRPDAVGTRDDALSVFGSFNADANSGVNDNAQPGKPGAGIGIKLGKSFSTGIAAQLLTEGLKQAATSTSAQACLAQAAAIAAKDVNQLDAAMRICAGK